MSNLSGLPRRVWNDDNDDNDDDFFLSHNSHISHISYNYNVHAHVLARNLYSITMKGKNFEYSNADFIDLPALTTLSLGEHCFDNATSVTFQNVGIMHLSMTAKNFTKVQEVKIMNCNHMKSILVDAMDSVTTLSIDSM